MEKKKEKKKMSKATETGLTRWEQLKQKSKAVGKVELKFNDGEVFPIEIQSLSQATTDAINEKYDDMKKPQPFVFIGPKKIEAPKDSPEYIAWDKENKAIDSLKFAEMAIAFMVEKPPGETTEEQIKELKEVIRPGDFVKIVQAGFKICGYDLDQEKIDLAKNS
jgi:hypothetical protein